MNRKSLLFIAGVALNIFIGSSQERVNLDLSSQPWNITLDHAAIWQNDELYLPPVDIKALPVNTPTGGWQLLKYPDKTGVNLPATVEEMFTEIAPHGYVVIAFGELRMTKDLKGRHKTNPNQITFAIDWAMQQSKLEPRPYYNLIDT